MKKWLVLLIIAGLIGTIYYLVVTYVEYTPKWLSGEKTTVKRGDIRSPISASGRVQPAEKIEIKSEASGKVMHILVEEGDYVRKNQTLIVLDPNDEELNRQIAQLSLEEATTNQRVAEEQATRAKDTGIPQARANLLAAEAELQDANSHLRKLEEVSDASKARRETEAAQAALKAQEARHLAAKAALSAANSDARLTTLQAELAKKAVETAKRNLRDAEERLSETVIKAPSDGMVAKLAVQVGTLVQSGTKSFTGGTTLLRLADTSKLYVIAMVDDADFGTVRKIAAPSARPQMRPGGPSRRGATTPATPSPTEANPGPTSAPYADPTKGVKVLVDTFPDEEFWGVIERIDPEGEIVGAMVQYRVHVRLVSENSFELLQLSLPAQVEFTAESRKDVLMVQSRCVRKEGDEYGVYVPDPTPEDKLNTRFVPVRTGITDGTYTEILPGSGLKEGDEVYLKQPLPPGERGK